MKTQQRSRASFASPGLPQAPCPRPVAVPARSTAPLLPPCCLLHPQRVHGPPNLLPEKGQGTPCSRHQTPQNTWRHQSPPSVAALPSPRHPSLAEMGSSTSKPPNSPPPPHPPEVGSGCTLLRDGHGKGSCHAGCLTLSPGQHQSPSHPRAHIYTPGLSQHPRPAPTTSYWPQGPGTEVSGG